MAYNNLGGYNAYKQVGVKTASPGKLIVMLYEGAVSHLEKALALIDDNNKIEAKNIENFGNHIQKVTDIISELQCSLNMEEGESQQDKERLKMSESLMSLYIWFNQELLNITINHDKKQLSNIYKMLSDLLDSWKNALNSGAGAGFGSEHQSLNITG